MATFFNWLIIFIVLFVCVFGSIFLVLILLRRVSQTTQALIADFVTISESVDLSAWLAFAVLVTIAAVVVAVPALASTVVTANLPPTPTATVAPMVIFVQVTPVPTATAAPEATPAPSLRVLSKCRCQPVLFGNIFCVENNGCGQD